MTIKAIIGIAIMVLGLIGMIVCSKKQRVNPALQPVSFVLFIVVLVGAFLFLQTRGLFGGSRGSGPSTTSWPIRKPAAPSSANS